MCSEYSTIFLLFRAEWLSPSTSGDMAYCRACKVELRPHVQDLKLHSTRVKHANNMKRSAGPAAGPLASFVDRRPREPCSGSSDDLKVAPGCSFGRSPKLPDGGPLDARDQWVLQRFGVGVGHHLGENQVRCTSDKGTGANV